MNHSIRSVVGLLLAAGLALAACTTAATPAPAAGGATPAASGSSGVTVGTATSAKLGVYLTGTGGMTLYILTKDSPNQATCTGSCATTWPPLTVSAGGSAQAGAGVTGTFATLTRADGSTQVTHNGMPLYYFKGDSKAGDTNGQGTGGVWFVATPAGGGPPASGAPSASPSGGGYNY
jgi:predicted lipoprotein with Yx(FWY)xxD motif